jgi:hypothetical protein
MTEYNNYAKINDGNIVVNIEVASQDWIDAWTADHPDSNERYVTAHSDLANKAAGLGYTFDTDTTWFIPPQPGPDWYFDRDAWEWIDPNPPEPEPEQPE